MNIIFQVIQFPLMPVFLHKEMKTNLLDICLFLLYVKTIPQKVLNATTFTWIQGQKYWLIFFRLSNFEIFYRRKLCRGRLFDGEKRENFIKTFVSFSRRYFSQLTFCHFQLPLKRIRWNSNENAFLYAFSFK